MKICLHNKATQKNLHIVPKFMGKTILVTREYSEKCVSCLPCNALEPYRKVFAGQYKQL